MKNWITTLGGAILAAVLIIVKLVSTHTLDPETIAIAGVVAAGGVALNDTAIIGFFKANPLADSALQLGDSLTANSNNKILAGIHGLLSELDQKVNALPDAVAAIVPTPIVATLDVTEAPAAEPVVEAPVVQLLPNPPGAKFDVNDGSPLNEDGTKKV